MKTKCYAKINLALDVLGCRSDGYHDVKTIMQTVSLCDCLTVDKCDDGIYVTCAGIELPCDQRNIAYKAAVKFFEYTGLSGGAKIHIEKKIPVGAGLGGGSSDAAGVLRLLNCMYNLKLVREQLVEIATQVGADVSFFLRGGCALAEGIGNILTPITQKLNLFCVVVKPKMAVSTRVAYENLIKIVARPNIDEVLVGIANANLKQIACNAANVFEAPMFEKYPEIAALKTKLSQAGGEFALMSGSGSSLYTVFPQKDKAQSALRQLSKYADYTAFCCFVNDAINF